MTKSYEAVLAQLLKEGRSHNGWLLDPVGDDELREAYDIAKWGPTSMNTQPMRALLLRSSEAKERLKPALAPANVSKVMTAPVVAVIAYDTAFYDLLPRVFPHNPKARDLFSGNEVLTQATAFRNGSLQAAYWMLSLRAMGLDVGPMSGFDPAKVDAEFFSKTSWRVNLICGIGHGDHSNVFDRSPRLSFEDVMKAL